MAPDNHDKKADYLIWSNTVDHVGSAIFGIIVSLYAYYVEIQKEKNPQYVAHCDFHENASCTRVLTSEYGKGFGLVQYAVGKESKLNIRNCLIGIPYFVVQLIIGLVPVAWGPEFLYYSSIIACIGCVYLAYILFFVLKDICVVCIATYWANFSLLYLNHARLS